MICKEFNEYEGYVSKSFEVPRTMRCQDYVEFIHSL